MFGFPSNSNILEFFVLSHAAFITTGPGFWETGVMATLTVSMGLDEQNVSG